MPQLSAAQGGASAQPRVSISSHTSSELSGASCHIPEARAGHGGHPQRLSRCRESAQAAPGFLHVPPLPPRQEGPSAAPCPAQPTPLLVKAGDKQLKVY